MKFSAESVSEGINHITGCDDTAITVQSYTLGENDQPIVHKTRLTNSCVVAPKSIETTWPPTSFENLAQTHFDQLKALEPELVLFGSGQRFQFPDPALTQNLIAANIGLESMDTAAACRTYNILVLEGRNVVAALLL